LPVVVERFRFAVDGFAALDDVADRALVPFVVVLVAAARLVGAGDDFALDRRDADAFLPPIGSASLTAFTAALAASPTVSTTFPAVLPAVLPTAPAVLPADFPTAPAVFPTVLTTSPG
jgi:hypothetical protein